MLNSSQVYKPKELKAIFKKGDMLDVPLQSTVDLEGLSPKELCGFIRDAVICRRRTVKNFKSATERITRTHMRLPPSMRKK